MKTSMMILLVFFLNIQIYAQDIPPGEPTRYFYDPTSTLALGSNFDPAFPSSPKRSCLKFTEKRLDPGLQKFKISYSYVKDYSSLYRALNYDLNIKATVSLGVGGGGADFTQTFAENNTFEENSVTVIAFAYLDYGRWGIVNDDLNSVGINLLEILKILEINVALVLLVKIVELL